MEVIAIVNQKGGVGKTTTAINLTSALAEMGKKILLVDMDPQANATQGVGVSKKGKTVYDILKGERKLNEVCYRVSVDEELKGTINIIPSAIELADAEIKLSEELGRETLLKEALTRATEEGVLDNYDYIIIDCNPSLGLLTVNALCAADSLIIPMEPSIFALDGIEKLVDIIKLVRRKINSDLQIKGVLLTRIDGRTNIAEEFERELKDIFGKKVFDTIIHQNVKINEAQTEALPINLYDKKARGAEEYSLLAKELINIE